MVLGVSLVAQQSVILFSVYASESSPYDSGYDHGCDDAGRSESDKYLNQPEKGPSFHTEEFMNGYYDGLNSCGGGAPPYEEPYYPPDEERHYEGHNWWNICQNVDNLLSEPCETLVTSDGYALTAEGKRVSEKLLCLAGQPIVGLLQPHLLPYATILCTGKG